MPSSSVACARPWAATGARCRICAWTTSSGRRWLRLFFVGGGCWRATRGRRPGGVPLERIEDISAGCVNPAHEGMGDVARWAALAAVFPDSVPAITVNRFCASSLSGAISIAHAIRSDELSVGLAGGVESMSRSGWALMKGEAPFMPRGPVLMLDTMWAGAGGPPNPTLLARDAYIDMMQTAQNVADRYELTREE